MKIAGIICECNPMHAGHVYLMSEARRAGADIILCVMSGCFMQRGEAAIVDPFARAEILVRAGADAVVELPFPFSASSAEFFGAAGVDILARLGIDELWFGSECGNIELLSRMAAIAESPEFLARYAETAHGNSGTARAYFDCLQEFCETDACSPNDILALSYLRALSKNAPHVCPRTVKRMGSGYSETALNGEKIPSATALRRSWMENNLDAIQSYFFDEETKIFKREETIGHAPASLTYAERWILGTLRSADAKKLSLYEGLAGGVAERLIASANNAKSLADLLERAATKKYPDARLRRAILSAITEVLPSDVRVKAAYTHLLAANQRGCSYLAQQRKTPRMVIVTRRGDIPEGDHAARQALLETREKALYSLCYPSADIAKSLLCHPPVIL